MAGFFNLFKKNENQILNTVPQIQIEIKKTEKGLEFLLFKETKEQPLELPLKLSIHELKQQQDIEMLEALEAIWYEELAEQNGHQYVIPVKELYTLPQEIKELLKIPDSTTFQLKLIHDGVIGTSRFQLVLDKSIGNWNHLQNIARQKGPWITLPDQSSFLMDYEQYEFEQMINTAPEPKNRELFSFIAKVRKAAKDKKIDMDEYLEKQEYLFVNEFDIDLEGDKNSISLLPKYKANEEVPPDLLYEMSNKLLAYSPAGKGKKVFVDPEIHDKAKRVKSVLPILDAQVPVFIDNPQAFLPELGEYDLSLFSERVRSLGIQVYKAQPHVFAQEKERGWFDLDIGFSALDENGETVADFEHDEIEDLIQKAKQKGEDYIQWNNHWLKIPEDAEEFIEATLELQKDINLDNRIDYSKLPYILEIYENINYLEYNEPMLEIQQEQKDLNVLSPNTPANFKATLMPFQTEGYIWMKYLYFRRLGGLLADDMGLGKTIQIISFLSYLKEQGQMTPSLIVAPKTLIENWKREIQKFAPDLLKSFYIHQGVSRLKKPSFIKQYGIVITTYQTLAKDQLIFAQINFQTIICDEAQAIKNPSTANSKVIKALKSRLRIAVTGTPVENSLSDLWSIMDYVQPGLLGSLIEFKRNYIDPLNTDDFENVEKELTSKISKVYKRRTKAGELKGQLPLKEPVLIDIGMGPVQVKLYREVLSLVKNKMMSGLEAIQKLKSLCAHPYLLDESYKGLGVKEVPKLKATLEIINEIKQKGEKVLIFTEYIKMQNLLKHHIREEFDITPPVINGMTERRLETVEHFNSKTGFDVMILSPKAAGTGLTITSANHVIHYTRWWNPAVENQATDRAYRIGQNKPVYIYYPVVKDMDHSLTNGTVEEIVHKILEEKQTLATSIMTPSKNINIESEVLNQVAL